MKETVQGWIERYLTGCARLYLWRTKPKVIGVTGSVGKTTTKEAIAFLLRSTVNSQLSSVRSAVGSMNAELGFPLAILGFHHVPDSLGWIWALPAVARRALFLERADWLILEYGIDKPGDMAHLLRIVRPEIAVITPIAEAHTEALGSLDGVYREKLKLLEQLKPRGLAIVPADDRRVMDEVVPERLTYGESSNADGRLVSVKSSLSGSTVKAKIGSRFVNCRSQLLGSALNQSLIVALLLAQRFGIRPEVGAKLLTDFPPVSGRLRVISGKQGTTILDDSYNANPASMEAALRVLDEVSRSRQLSPRGSQGSPPRRLATRSRRTSRRVAVLGEMRELGKLAESAHRRLGELIPKFCDLAIIVGPWRETTVQAALKQGFGVGQIVAFETTAEAINELPQLIEPRDVILVKASQNEMRFERIVETLMARPQDAKKLLVRQSRYWKRKQ